MVTMQEVDKQLKAIGVTGRFWGRPEMLELQHILIPGERIHGLLNGRYEGGFATLVATDQRILLIDKKLFHLSVEDLRYDMISEVDYSAQLAGAALVICTPTKKMTFQSLKPRQMRAMGSFIQQRVIEIRQQFNSQPTAQPASQQPQLPKISQIPQAPFIDPRVPLQQAMQEQQLEPQFQQPVAPAPAQAAPESALPMPQFGRNPYAATSMTTRRRIGRFGTIGSVSPRPAS